MEVKMFDLKEQYESQRSEIINILDKVMSNSQFILGDYVKEIEKKISSLSNVPYGIGVANGSDAIHIALEAANIGEGDEVIIPSFTFFATAGAVVRAGAKPVFVDINPVTFNINTDLIEELINSKTKAIIPVHLYGQMADMEKIQEIATRNNLIVIEDAAQAIGATCNGKQVGEISDAATYSFFPTKNLGAFGDGGMIVTQNKSLAEKAKIIRVHGSKPKYHHHVVGYNSRLDEIQAAILTIKYPYLKKRTEMRREIANYYNHEFEKRLSNLIKIPLENRNKYHVYHQYTIRTSKRDELREYLDQNGITTMIYYPIPLHMQPVFKNSNSKVTELPETELAAIEALSLPMYPELKREEQDYVIDKVVEFFEIKGEFL